MNLHIIFKLNIYSNHQVVLLAGLIFLTHLDAIDIFLKQNLGKMLGDSV